MLEKISCVYAIKCKQNGMTYIGITKNFARRIWVHKTNFRKNNGNPYLLEDWNKYDETDFEYFILESGDKQYLVDNKREDFWIKELNTIWPNGYNIHPGTTPKGSKMTEKTKKIKSDITKGLSNPNSKDKQVYIDIKKMLDEKIPVRKISTNLKISQETIYQIKRGTHWSCSQINNETK